MADASRYYLVKRAVFSQMNQFMNCSELASAKTIYNFRAIDTGAFLLAFPCFIYPVLDLHVCVYKCQMYVACHGCAAWMGVRGRCWSCS